MKNAGGERHRLIYIRAGSAFPAKSGREAIGSALRPRLKSRYFNAEDAEGAENAETAILALIAR